MLLFSHMLKANIKGFLTVCYSLKVTLAAAAQSLQPCPTL